MLPKDMNGFEAVQQRTERDAQARQKRQIYIDFSHIRLRGGHLERKTQEYLMEYPNATWKDYPTRLTQREVSCQVFSNFLNDEEETRAQIATQVQEIKKLQSELRKYRVGAIEGNSRPVAQIKKKTKCNTILQLCLCEKTHSKLVS